MMSLDNTEQLINSLQLFAQSQEFLYSDFPDFVSLCQNAEELKKFICA